MTFISSDAHFLSANENDTDASPIAILPPSFTDTLPGPNPNSATKQDTLSSPSSNNNDNTTPLICTISSSAASPDSGIMEATITPVPAATTGTNMAAPSKTTDTTGLTHGHTQEQHASVAEKTKTVKLQARNLVLWTNPIQSGAALVSLLALSYASYVYSPIRLFTLLIASATFANMIFVNLWVIGGSFFVNSAAGIKKPPTMWFLDQTHRHPIQHKHVREWVDFAVDFVNILFSQLASIIAVDDNLKSFAALVATTTLYIISAYVSTPILLLVASIISFTAPKVYLMFQPQIDAHLHQVTQVVHKNTKGFTDAANKYFESARAKAQARVAAAQNKTAKKAE
ncbi:Reticulon-domain-containing protein [Phlyctochytrium arcticum]|nr:Reticulon-domain-containing protein [Phlyctochytrium arcticum]KAI9095237.1 Reticulon-domain-containing protein [Phlyctochytrium arcticum]